MKSILNLLYIFIILNLFKNVLSLPQYELIDITNEIDPLAKSSNEMYSQNNQCKKTSFTHIKLLSPTTNYFVFPYLGNGILIQLDTLNFLLKWDVIISVGRNVLIDLPILDNVGTQIQSEFFNYSCIEFQGTVQKSTIDNTLYKYRHYKGFHGILIKQDNIDLYLGNLGVDQIVSNTFNNGYNDKMSKLYSDIDPHYTIYNIIPTLQVNGETSVTITTSYTYSFGNLLSNPFTLTTFFSSSTLSPQLITKFQVSGDCANLIYPQCIILLKLNTATTLSDYYLSTDNEFDRMVLVSGSTIGDGLYYAQFTRFSDTNQFQVYAFENNAYLLLDSKTPINYIGPTSNPSTSLTETTLMTTFSMNPSVRILTKSYVSMDYFGDFKFNSSKFGYHNPTTIKSPGFPFNKAYGGSLQGELYIPISQYLVTVNQLGVDFYFSGYPYQFPLDSTSVSSSPLSDTIKPEFFNVEYFDLQGLECLVRITARDDGGSGIQLIVISFFGMYSSNSNAQNKVRITATDLIDGDINNGVYQFKIPKYIIRQNYYIEMIDFVGNQADKIYPNTFISTYNYLPSFPYKVLSPIDISNISFSHSPSILNLNGTSATSTMFIKLTNETISNLVFQFIPSYGIDNYQYDKPISGEAPFFTSIWNSTMNRYEIQFTLPANLPSGPISYLLNPIEIDSSTFYSYLGSSSELVVSSDQVDVIGPIVSQVLIIGSDFSIPATGSKTIGYSFTVTDDFNGIKEINVTIGSDRDPIGKLYNFKLSTPQILQYNFNCTWNLNAGDGNSIYKILKMTTSDYAGYSTEYPNQYKVNPLMNVIENGGLTITTSTSYSIIDNSPPVLYGYSTSHTVISDYNDRKLIINFTISDIGSGIDINYIPVVTLSPSTLDFISKDAVWYQKNMDITNSFIKEVLYSCEIELPYLYGYPQGFFIHVHGSMDNRMNYAGYSPKLIGSADAFINVTVGQPEPMVYSTYFDLTASDLTIFGYKFGISPTVYVKGNGIISTFAIPTPFINESYIIINVRNFRADVDLNLTIVVSNLNLQSIPYQIILPSKYTTPTPSPPILSPTPTISTPLPINTDPPLVTNKPSPCKGTPLCGGLNHGKCELLGCNCISPWFGVDCLSKLINEEIIPIINQTQPKVELPYIPKDKVNVIISSEISIYSLRELDINNKVINEYIFNYWDHQIIDTVSDGDNSISNSYTTKINNKNDLTNNSITEINVTIKKFNQLTIVEFANENITCQQGSIKYYITISNYQFLNKLSTMDLLITASIQTNESDSVVCSSTEFGDSTSQLSSHFIKVQINDVYLFGEFIKRAIVDGKIIGVSNKQLTEFDVKGTSGNGGNTGSSSKTYVSIEIPNYSNKIEIDPNFSVLISSDEDTVAGNDQICSNNSKSGLTKNQLIGIIIGSVGVVMVVSIVIGAIVYKKSTSLRIRAKEFRMRSFSIKKINK